MENENRGRKDAAPAVGRRRWGDYAYRPMEEEAALG